VKRFALAIGIAGCAAGGPHDVLDGTGREVQVDASAPRSGYVYVARRALVAVGLAASQGLTDEEAHRAVDRLADEASACFKRSKELAAGATHIVLPIDPGGTTGAPTVTFSPQTSAVVGMVCILAPIRLSTFAPGSARSITIEAAWGTDLSP
jgi:hypothetical protein